MRFAMSFISAIAVLVAGLPAWTDTGTALPAGPVVSAPGPIGDADLKQGLQLVMVDLAGCVFCAKWKREVLPVYARHPEGRAAPVTIIPIGGPWPDGLALAGRPKVTPTFILLDGGLELARIEGYDGAEAFWSALHRMLGDTPDRIGGLAP